MCFLGFSDVVKLSDFGLAIKHGAEKDDAGPGESGAFCNGTDAVVEDKPGLRKEWLGLFTGCHLRRLGASHPLRLEIFGRLDAFASSY
ncbi:hypothetical protein ERJ75_000522300 [Trypanosoma vivax]|nr:hypothetical protein ERJ75_000522300 [Trypanosoma vivax]